MTKGIDRADFWPIFEDLRDQIRSGTLALGAKLPSIPDLMETYGASTGVVRRALVELRTEGLIRTQQGKGSFVRDELPSPDDLRDFEQLTRALDAVSDEVRSWRTEIADLRRRVTALESGRAGRQARPEPTPPARPARKSVPRSS